METKLLYCLLIIADQSHKRYSMKLQNIQILVIRLALAGLFFHLGIGKISDGWLTSPAGLLDDLQGYQKHATGIHLQYLSDVAIPYVNIWSKLITIGETLVGISMLLGLFVRLSSLAGILMVLNLHAATGNLYSLNFFGSAWAALIIASFIATGLAGAGRWMGFDQLLARSNANSILW